MGNPFDRFKWTGTLFQKLLQAEAINALWTKLKQLYGVGAAPFLIDRGFPEEVRRPHSPPLTSPEPVPTPVPLSWESAIVILHISTQLHCMTHNDAAHSQVGGGFSSTDPAVDGLHPST